MTPAGRAVVKRAKADGSWTILDDVEALVIPDDLAALLDGDPEARANFEAYPRSAKMAFLWWLKSAKTEATRAKRLDGTLRAARQDVRVPGQAK
ncbi:MAG: YdeI family protein [Dehalococcoidia bacterium]